MNLSNLQISIVLWCSCYREHHTYIKPNKPPTTKSCLHIELQRFTYLMWHTSISPESLQKLRLQSKWDLTCGGRMNRKSFWCREAHTAAFSVEPPAKTIELTIHGKLTLTFGIDIDMEHLFFDVCTCVVSERSVKRRLFRRTHVGCGCDVCMHNEHCDYGCIWRKSTTSSASGNCINPSVGGW